MEENNVITIDEMIRFFGNCADEYCQDTPICKGFSTLMMWLQDYKRMKDNSNEDYEDYELGFGDATGYILNWLNDHADDYTVCNTGLGRVFKDGIIPDIRRYLASVGDFQSPGMKILTSDVDISSDEAITAAAEALAHSMLDEDEEEIENENDEMEAVEKADPITDVKALQLSHNTYECYDEEGRYVRGFDLNGPYCRFAVYSYCDESFKKPLKVLDTYTGKIYKDLYLANLYVRPDFRNMGIGQLVLDQTAKFAKDNGFSTIYLWAEEGSWQETWYKKNGFKSCHSYKEDYDTPAPGVTITSDNPNKKYLWMYKEV